MKALAVVQCVLLHVSSLGNTLPRPLLRLSAHGEKLRLHYKILFSQNFSIISIEIINQSSKFLARFEK